MELGCATKVARVPYLVATNRATKIRIETSSFSLQLVVETPNADWPIHVYVWLFLSLDRCYLIRLFWFLRLLNLFAVSLLD